MKIKSTFLILFISIWVNQFYGQFTPQKPDLRDCGNAPNYYLDYFNCTSNNYTLDDVYLSISSSSGVPITTPCAPPNVQNVFLWLNYTSNSNSSIHQTRIFADILVKDQNGNLIQTLEINSYLGEVVPGIGQRLLSLPIPYNVTGFPWTCGYELSLTRLLVVWKTNGNTNDPELSSYICNTFSKSQCELPTSLIVSAPMAVQFDYTQCTIGNTTTVNFDDDTNGGDPPYTYLWNFGDSTTSTLQNPSHTYPYPGGPYTVTLQVTDSGSPQQVSTSVQVINLINPINISGNVTSSPCSSGNVGAIDISVSGGTPGYTYLWSNGATSQDVTGLANGSYTVTVTDSVGCTAQRTFIITGGDVTPPVVTAPANQTLEGCNTTILGLSGYFAFSSTSVTITEAQFILAGGTIADASAISSVTYIDTVLGTCPRVVSRLFTITDTCNNATQVIQTFTIQDTTDPVISTPVSSLTVECDGSGNASALAAWLASNGGASASDVCSGVTWSNNYSSLSDLCGATGSASVTFTATDACGNTSSSIGTFTIQDTTDPIISTPVSSLTVECDGSGNASDLATWLASNGGASASDVCSGVTWTNNYSSLSDLCGATGSASVTFTATDACGNSSTSIGTFTIQDTTDPIISTPVSSLTVECDGSGNASDLAAWLASNGGASASDVCSGVTWSNNYSSLSDLCGATGSASVTFTATDACGNTSTSIGTFTIQDTTDPTIDIQVVSQTVECDGSGNASALAAWLASNGGASASDVCSGVTWTNNYSSLSDLCGATGSASVTFTATDACGNSSTSIGTFTIQDTTDPIISTPVSSLTVECDGSGNVSALAAWLASNGGASASDVCSGVTWSNNYSSLSDLCGATGSASVTFTATDACGNSSTSIGTFTIQDTTDPTIDIQVVSQTVECDGSGNASDLAAWLASNGGASASDVCSGVTWSNNYSSLSDLCGATGSASVTFTATDACGNTSTSIGTFTIQDTTDPTIDIQVVSQSVECDGSGNASDLAAWLASNGGASASDVCSGVTWTNNYSSLSDLCGATGSASVTFTATDACGNTSTSIGTFTIQDTTDPSLITQANDLTVICDGNGNSQDLASWLASNGGASASDVCSGVTWTNNYSSLSDLCGANGSAIVTFTATDACGNASISSGTFTIIDNIKPVIETNASNLTVECDGNGNNEALANWLSSNGGASASDNCSSVTWSNDYSGSLSDLCGLTGSVTVIFTARDDCGNFSISTGIFTIIDTTSPEISTQASNSTVECDGAGNIDQLNAWLASNGGASASDVCSGVTWTNNFNEALFSDECGLTGSATVVFTATDECGNTSTSSGTFIIQDTTDPILITQAISQTVECDGAGNLDQLNAWLASNGGASASDVCSGVTWSNDFNESLSDNCGLTGSATVVFTATDACGNTSTSSGTFTIQDTTDPIFTSELPANISVSCDAIPAPEELTGSDSCSSEITITSNDDIVENESTCIGEFTILRTWTITDSCGNNQTYTQTISVFDNAPPTLVTPFSTEVDAVCSGIPPKPYLEFVDNCSGVNPNIIFTETTTIISIYEYIIIRNWIVSDNCGNEASFSQTINVTVTEPFDAIPYRICKNETKDLFTLLPTGLPTNGTWVEVNTTGAISGSTFNPSSLAYGYYTIQYIVSLENNPCPLIYEIYIHVDNCDVLAICDIVVYNAVSPNGDGLNEVFVIDGITCYPNNTVEIYNRWGVSVYKASGYNNGSVSFDGQSQNKLTVGDDKLPGDTYFYILKYINSENNSIEKTGYLYVKY